MASKSGQGWGFDLMIASVIFVIVLVVFYLFMINSPTSEQETLDSMGAEAKGIGDSLISEGSPVTWNTSNFVRIGILSDHRINETKLENFYTLSDNNYALTKASFKTKNNYYVNFSQPVEIDGEDVWLIGQYPSGANNLVKVSRIVVYRNKIVSMDIGVWN